MNTITNFAHTSTIISKTISKLLEVTPAAPKTFRLSVATPADVAGEGIGQYKVEAPVVAALLDTSYAEVVSAANRVPRKDSIPVADRGRSLSGYDDKYDGAEEPEETEETLEEQLQAALDRAAVVLRYGKHIASIKDGGAEWLLGFEVDKWVPTPGLTDDPDGKYTLDEVLRACTANTGLARHIKEGRVTRVKSVVDNKLPQIKEWINNQLFRDGIAESWAQKLAYASVLGLRIDDVEVNVAKSYIGDIVTRSAFRRETTRLEDAISRVANRRYLGLAYLLNEQALLQKPSDSEIAKAVAKAWPFLQYSSLLQQDVAEVKASDEYQDWLLQKDLETAKEAAQRDLRQAMREKALFGMEQYAAQAAAIRDQAAAIRASITQQREALASPAPVAPQADPADEAKAKAKKAAAAKKAAETRKRNAEAKAEAKRVKGVHGTGSKIPSYQGRVH